MKILKEYKNFVANNMQKINEGGGAGKEFIFEDVEFRIVLTYSKRELEEHINELNLGESFDLIGYQDGLRNINLIDRSLLEHTLTYKIDEEKLSKITLKNIEYYTHDLTFENEYDDNTTLGEISEKEDIEIEISGYGQFTYMYGAGWLTSIITAGDEILNTTLDLHDGYDSFINNAKVYDCLNKYCDLDINIKLVASEDFQDLWQDVFLSDDDDDDDDHHDYLEMKWS